MNRQQRRAAVTGIDVFATAVAANAAGRLDEAARGCRRVLADQPGHDEALHLSAVVALRQERPAEALEFADAALARRPGSAALHHARATALRALGRPDEAVDAYQRAIAAQPSHVGALNDLGRVFLAQGRTAEAIPVFERAAAHAPDPRILANLAHALRDAGEADRALAAATRALLGADTREARALFLSCIAGATTIPVAAEAPLARALDEGWARPRDLVRPALLALRSRGRIAPLMTADAPLTSEDISGLASGRLLRALIAATPVADPALERVLTAARAALLAGAAPDALAFWCALARHCFLTDYAFAETADERSMVDALAAEPDPSPIAVVTIAAYQRHSGVGGSLPAPVEALLDTVVRAPADEAERRARIPVLTPIDDTSTSVREQYEENPYPRWSPTAPAGDPVPLNTFFTTAFPAGAFRPTRVTAPSTLVAGCGTGQQAVDSARRFAESRVLAVDLSLTSLAYAQRVTGAAGLGDRIRYAQADLLSVPALGQTFDVIEATGVLHHLANPWDGFRALLSVLRPNGVMLVGLYSERARRDVIAAHAFIAEQNFPDTPDGIRACRKLMMAAPIDTPLGRLARSADFASLSECRDLLFHVREHRLAPPAIAAFVAEAGLTVIGLDVPASATHRYADLFPNDAAQADLRRWDAVEAEHPETFAGMVQFWVQSPPG